MTDIYIQLEGTHGGLYPNAPVRVYRMLGLSNILPRALQLRFAMHLDLVRACACTTDDHRSIFSSLLVSYPIVPCIRYYRYMDGTLKTLYATLGRREKAQREAQLAAADESLVGLLPALDALQVVPSFIHTHSEPSYTPQR